MSRLASQKRSATRKNKNGNRRTRKKYSGGGGCFGGICSSNAISTQNRVTINPMRFPQNDSLHVGLAGARNRDPAAGANGDLPLILAHQPAANLILEGIGRNKLGPLMATRKAIKKNVAEAAALYKWKNEKSVNINKVSQWIKAFPNAETLKINGSFDMNTASSFALHLHELPRLKKLVLKNTKLRDQLIAIIATALPKCERLEALDMSDNKINTAGMTALAEVLPRCKKLTELRVGWNRWGGPWAPFDDTVIEPLARALPECSQLTKLYISEGFLGNRDGAVTLAGGLSMCRQLKSLSLNGNSIGSEGLIAVATALENCPQLSELHLYRNNIGEEGAAALAALLKTRKYFTVLDIGANEINDAGAVAIANALPACKELNRLSLYYTNIGDTGIMALAGALPKVLKLSWLNISAIHFSVPGFTALSKALESCTELTSLGVNQPMEVIRGEAAPSFAFIAAIPKLKELNFNDIFINNASAADLAKVLPQCANLTFLRLDHNQIGNSGAVQLANVLPRCLKLASLDLYENYIGNVGAAAIASVLPQCPQLTSLEMGSNRFRDFLSLGSWGWGWRALQKAAALRPSLHLKFSNF